MLGVGQSTILEHHLVHGRFVLKWRCIAIFIYQNDNYERVNEQKCHILSIYPIFIFQLSMQKVKVSPRRNVIHSNVQIQYKYHLGKICDVNHKNRIFLHSSKNQAWHCKRRSLTINRIGISLTQKHGVLHFTNTVCLLCTPFGKSGVVYTGPLSTQP